MVDWPSYNRSLVRRGEILFSYDFLDSWDSYLERMNENKKGRQTIFLPRLIYPCYWYIRLCFHLPYRQTEDVIKATVGKTIPSHPSYGHICKRINRLSVDIKKEDDRTDSDNDEIIIVAVDSTCIKVTKEANRCLTNGV